MSVFYVCRCYNLVCKSYNHVCGCGSYDLVSRRYDLVGRRYDLLCKSYNLGEQNPCEQKLRLYVQKLRPCVCRSCNLVCAEVITLYAEVVAQAYNILVCKSLPSLKMKSLKIWSTANFRHFNYSDSKTLHLSWVRCQYLCPSPIQYVNTMWIQEPKWHTDIDDISNNIILMILTTCHIFQVC